MQQKFNILDGLCVRKRCLLIYEIMKYQTRKQIASGIDKLNREEKVINKRKEGQSKPSSEKSSFANNRTITSR